MARLPLLLALGLAGGGAVAAGYWWLEIRPRVARVEDPQAAAKPTASRSVAVTRDRDAVFDVELQLPSGPIGIAAGEGLLVVGNREDPWGFFRLRAGRGGERFEIQKVPVIERTYAQTVSFSAVTWNGESFVGYTRGSWFGRQADDVFTLHDASDLRVTRTFAAPPLLGCLAWDGNGYWAATRRNTRDADEEAFLYQLDASFRVVARHEPPGVGCQGLAWDGSRLWFADVFDDSLSLLRVRLGTPEVERRERVRFEYLSGVGYLDGHIWVADYDDDRLRRLNPKLQMAWTASPGAMPSGEPAERMATLAEVDEEEVVRLREQLRSRDSFERMAARTELERAGVAVDYDRWEDPFATASRGAEAVEIQEWEVEARGGSLLGSWRIHFGSGLFEGERRQQLFGAVELPLFVRYTVSVEGGTLPQEIERRFDAYPGVNDMQDVELAAGLGPGRYEAFVFVHVQYVREDGTAQILNNSGGVLSVDVASRRRR